MLTRTLRGNRTQVASLVDADLSGAGLLITATLTEIEGAISFAICGARDYSSVDAISGSSGSSAGSLIWSALDTILMHLVFALRLNKCLRATFSYLNPALTGCCNCSSFVFSRLISTMLFSLSTPLFLSVADGLQNFMVLILYCTVL